MTARELRLWLTMGDDGFGVLTHRRPVVARVEGTNRRGVYARPGDMVLIRSLCADALALLLGTELPPACDPLRVLMTLRPANRRKVA